MVNFVVLDDQSFEKLLLAQSLQDRIESFSFHLISFKLYPLQSMLLNLQKLSNSFACTHAEWKVLKCQRMVHDFIQNWHN
jgi:hypothetical protein